MFGGAFFLALRAFGGGLWKIAQAIPWQVYAVLGVLISLYGFAVHERHVGRDQEIAKLAAAAESQRKAQERVDALAHAKALQDAASAKAHIEAQDLDLQRAADEIVALRGSLKGEKSAFTPPATVARFGELPAGYMLWRDAAVAVANGGDTAVAGPAKESVDRPSGVSLDRLEDLDAEQALAFRQAVTWGAGWKNYALEIKRLCEANIETLKGR